MALLLMPVLFSCATYNKSMDAYYSSLQARNYDKALQKLEKNKLIKRDRNSLLYHLEAGRVYRLKNDPVQSNIHFNVADEQMEAARKSAKDIALGNLVNPMMESYRGEDFEPFMVHFYKALNYITLGQTAEAVVEARRITLSADRQAEKFNNKSGRYSKDAFAFNLQGMIYELSGDMNNAFIAYRNAVEVYLGSGDSYYGVALPAQLTQDLLHAAAAMGFTDEQARYEKLLQTKMQQSSTAQQEMILFIEEGNAPVKEEKSFFLTNAGINGFSYTDQYGYNASFPFDHQYYGISEPKLSAVRTLRVAMPVYRLSYQQKAAVSITSGSMAYTPQLAADINTVAVSLLKERFVKELANALARQVTKKLVEKGTEKAAEGIARKKEKKSDKENSSEEEKEKKRQKNEENAKAVGEVAGLLMNIANTVSEKADTRNWQSLPAFISYVRIPLQAGENLVTISANGKTQTLKVQGDRRLQMLGVVLD